MSAVVRLVHVLFPLVTYVKDILSRSRKKTISFIQESPYLLQQDSSLGSFEGDPVVSEESLTDVETSHRRTSGKSTSATTTSQTSRKVQEAISRHQTKANSVSVFWDLPFTQ